MTSKNCIYFLSMFTALATVTLASGATIVHSDQSMLLSDLVGGGTISVGDKTFGDFTYSSVGDMPAATAVNVIPIVSDGDYGVRFQGGFVDLVGGSASSDSLITFSVTAPAPWITGARMYGNVDGPAGGLASITETFLPTLPNTALTITSGVNLQASTSFAPLQKLFVQKDILLVASDNEPATVSFVDQAFPQVPEPSAGLVLLLGLCGLFVSRRKRD